MLGIAFKEWAGVCRAVAAGEQVLLLRKGGIHEVGGEFRPEYSRFWLYETHFHEHHRTGLKPSMTRFVDEAEADRPPAGTLRFSTFVDVVRVEHLTNLDAALALDAFHGWTAETVAQRFHYRTPGLFALTVRAFRVAPINAVDRPEYAGCKTWVPLDPPLPTAGAEPILQQGEPGASATGGTI